MPMCVFVCHLCVYKYSMCESKHIYVCLLSVHVFSNYCGNRALYIFKAL